MTLLLLCLAIALSGCRALIGGEPDSGSGGSGGAGGAGGAVPGAPGADDPIKGGGAGVEPPNPIFEDAFREKPDPTVVDARPVAVDHFAIGADGRTILIYWWGGNSACFGMKEVMVDDQRGTPIITVLEGTRGDHVGMACTMEALLKVTVVTLDEPIVADAANPDAEPGEPQLPEDAAQAKPAADVRNPIPHAISGFRLSADGLTLNAYYVGGIEDCYGLADATAEPDAAGLLTVSIQEGSLPNGDVACEDIGVAKVVEFTLDAPLIAVAAFDS